MPTRVCDLSVDELRDVLRAAVETAVERKLLEIHGDPDEGLVVRRRVRDRLLRQQHAVAGGERGADFEQAIRAYGWE